MTQVIITAENSTNTVIGVSSSYSVARSTSSSFSDSGTLNVGQLLAGPTYLIYRAFIKFDTSSIPNGATINQVNLRLVATQDNSDTDFDVQIVKQDWSAQVPIAAGTREAAYDNCLSGTADNNIWRNTSGMALVTQYTSGNLDTNWIDREGFTHYSLRSNRDFSGTAPVGNERIGVGSSSNANSDYRPALIVDYTEVTPSGTLTISSDTDQNNAINLNVTRGGSGEEYVFPEDSDTLVGRVSSDTLTNKTITAPVVRDWTGWVDANETWTYASSDDPTYTFTISGDKTSKYSAGMKIKLTDSGTQYFIITKVAYSDPNTTITLYGGTDYDLSTGAITGPFYSTMKAPQGFPLDPDKWTIETTDASARTQSSPTADTWYNLGSILINIPIGVWDVEYLVSGGASDTSVDELYLKITLSTANNSESDVNWTTSNYWDLTGQSGNPDINWLFNKRKIVNISTKDTYYLNCMSTLTLNQIAFRGNQTVTTIKATCAYL